MLKKISEEDEKLNRIVILTWWKNWKSNRNFTKKWNSMMFAIINLNLLLIFLEFDGSYEQKIISGFYSLSSKACNMNLLSSID